MKNPCRRGLRGGWKSEKKKWKWQEGESQKSQKEAVFDVEEPGIRRTIVYRKSSLSSEEDDRS